jgi:hypothetical protein
MKKIITTLTAITFALGVAAAAQAQVVKTPEKPAVQSTQAAQPQAATQEAAKPVTPETVKPGDKTKEVLKPGDQEKAKKTAKKEAKKAEKKGAAAQKPGAHLETVPPATK